MLRDLNDQERAKENQELENSQPAPAAGSRTGAEGKPDEEFQTIEHDEANDDSEFETEEENDEVDEPMRPGSMFENLLRSHGLLRPPVRGRQGPTPRDALHPFTQVLSVANVDDCVLIENACFPAEERASQEKFQYRLAKCPELSFGVLSLPTLAERPPGQSKIRPRLVAHILATRTISSTVTDAAMALPTDWQTKITSSGDANEQTEGHQDQGRTVCVHSLAVLPEHHGKQIGSMLMQAYIERIKSSKIADRIALLAHGDLIPFYEKLGFKNVGASQAKFGGGNWTDMVLEFDNLQEEEE